MTASERVRGDLDSLPVEELVQVNLDVAAAVATILRVLPGVRQLRPRLTQELRAFDLAAFDKLEDYVLALSFAQRAYVTASRPEADPQVLMAAATKSRELLLADAHALSLHGLIDEEPLTKLKGANGYKNVANDLLALSQLLQASWTRIQGKLATTLDDLAEANRMAARLHLAVELREDRPAVLAAVMDQRARAFTLAMRVYETTRRAIRHLSLKETEAQSLMLTCLDPLDQRELQSCLSLG